MPNTDRSARLRTLLQAARSSAGTLSSTLAEIEVELATLEQESQAQPTSRLREKKADPHGCEAAAINAKQLLTVKEAAVVLNVHWQTVNSLIYKGILPVCRIGRVVRISRKAIEQFID